MKIIFTRHSIKRIEERNIQLREVIVCFKTPDKVKTRGNNRIYLKLDESKKKLIILICSIKEERCKIITVIKTSKVKKYL